MDAHLTPEQIIQKEKELAGYDGPDRVISSQEYLEFIRHLPPAKKFATGFPTLDGIIDQFQQGELIVVSGPTCMGKTLFCDAVIRNARAQSVFSLFFSFEVGPDTIARAHDTPETVLFLPLAHQEKNLPWLKERCWEAKIKYGVDIVVIDHLHYVVDMRSQHNMSLEIGATMRFLKQLAKDLKMVVVLVCHIKTLNMDQEPGIEHLRDSSFVGQEADTVLMLFRRFDKDFTGKSLDTMDQGLATIKVCKARRTGKIHKRVKIRKEGDRLVESLGEPEEEKREPRTRTGFNSHPRSYQEKAAGDDSRYAN